MQSYDMQVAGICWFSQKAGWKAGIACSYSGIGLIVLIGPQVFSWGDSLIVGIGGYGPGLPTAGFHGLL